MEYYEAANFLQDLRRFRMDPGTESVEALLAELGDPAEGVTFVQVAGSNGKGSVARMTESVLREAGYRVGLYTSPHFEDLRERVRVDGRKMTQGAVASFVESVKPWLVDRAVDGEPLTTFEVLTAMAVHEFGRRDVDVAVLEVGMGGELDATSAVDPTAACVTNVTLEHTGVLGDTVEEIATTKAHVAPADAPLVTGATGDALAAVREQAGEVVTVGGDDADVTATYGGRISESESAVAVDGDGWAVDARLPLLGRHQAANAGIACALARQVGAALGAPETVGETAIARGLRNAHWPGRFEVFSKEPLVVLDGAHNPGACETLARTLGEFEYAELHLAFGAMHDKDHAGMAAALSGAASVVTCRPDTDRAEDPEVLAGVFADAGVENVAAGDAVVTALRRARDRADPDDVVVLAGSLSCVAEARSTWTRLAVPRTVADADDAARVLDVANVPPEREAVGGDLVHRTLTTRLPVREARALRERALAAGLTCALSGHRDGEEHVDAVLAGSEADLAALAEVLAGPDSALDGVARSIRNLVGEAAETEETTAAGVVDADRSTTRGSGGSPADAPWADGTAVMGVVNVTPDSFHDGGEYLDTDEAVARAESLVEAGAEVVDVGGESTRPGADPVTAATERDRVVPVVEALADADAWVSIDTRKPAVAAAALDAGADLVNDVTGLGDPEMRELVAERGVPVVVMHSIDAPVVPDRDAEYDDAVSDVLAELGERVLLAEKAGIPREHVVVDPGIGFGKDAAENFELLGRLEEFRALGCPVMVGHSHKSMFELVGGEAGDALAETLAATAIAADRGVDLIRVHDVAENVRAVNVALAAEDPDRF